MRNPSSLPAAASQSGSSPNGLVAALVVATIAVTGALVWMVRVKSQATEVGYRISSLRTELITLEQQRAALEVEKSALMRPTRLVDIARTQLGLVPPDPSTAVSLLDQRGEQPR